MYSLAKEIETFNNERKGIETIITQQALHKLNNNSPNFLLLSHSKKVKSGIQELLELLPVSLQIY